MGRGSGVGMAGPLAAFAAGFSAELVRLGYRPGSAAAQLQLMAEASAWLAGQDLQPCDLSEARVAQLMSARRAAGRSRLLSVRAIVPLLGYLRGDQLTGSCRGFPAEPQQPRAIPAPTRHHPGLGISRSMRMSA